MTNKLTQFTTHSSLFTNFAFTLSETLIVMGIIGVVAALTLPNLNSSTGDKEKVAKVKKIYSNLNDAYGRVEAVYGPSKEWLTGDFFNDTNRITERFMDFLKVSKACESGTGKGCFYDNLKGPGGSMVSGVNIVAFSRSCILADGASIAFGVAYGTQYIFVDIDGHNKGQNTYGSDIFVFKFDNASNYELVPYKPASFSTYLTDLKSGGARVYASGWIIDYDNMDYLKFDSSGKCPNNVTVNETNPSCK
ncbi:type II secretion system protein [bacterium]|nr:type II secretion system protein [bacterium]